MNGHAFNLRKFKKKHLKIAVIAAVVVLSALVLGGCASEPSGNGEPNGLWELFCQFLASIVEAFYQPVHDWGLAIILITIVFRLIISPLAIGQTKSSYQMQKLQPQIKVIQERFADDPTRQNEELQKLYAGAKYNPLAGCVPMLLQMPIFIALFTVLRNISSYITSSTTFSFYNIVPDLLLTPSDTFGQGFIVFLPYLILMLVFALVTFLPMVLQQLGSDSPQKNQMLIMAAVMSLMMLWISWSSPAGVLLFWGTSSIIAVVQQQVVMHSLKKKDEQAEEEIAERQVVVDVERKVKKKRPSKKR